jgi:hypothetical protein
MISLVIAGLSTTPSYVKCGLTDVTDISNSFLSLNMSILTLRNVVISAHISRSVAFVFVIEQNLKLQETCRMQTE